tara:strand:+ start:855 stop:1046 length:192 start_codon:yes stop_codon:yes gene_type:complete
MDGRISGFHQEERFWVAELESGYQQHVRHNPPMTLHPWVNDENGRKERLGTFLLRKAYDSKSL